MNPTAGPPTGATTPPPTSYRASLDGVRAFCIIFTIFVHIPGTPDGLNGRVGVDVFFALSGWLITWLLIEERRKTATINLPAFFARRAFRILPLYLVVLAAYAVAAWGLGLGGADKVRQFHAAFPYLATFNSEYRPAAGGVLFGHAWTLGIEEKFYLVWPLLVVFGERRPWLAAAGGVLTAALLIAVSPAAMMITRGYFGLGFGAALALTISGRAALIDRLRSLPLALPLMVPLACTYALTLRNVFDIRANLLIAAFGGLVIVSLWFNERQPLARLLAVRPLPALGRLTYALYLIHVLAINVVVAVAGRLHLPRHWLLLFAASYALAIVVAYGLHKVVEKPLINVGKRLAIRIRPAGQVLRVASRRVVIDVGPRP